MARGHPDWGVLQSAISSHETDLGELAARLGSPYTFTRTGKVLFLDTFRSGIAHWISTLSGSGSSNVALLTTGFFAPGSLRQISGTPVGTAHATLSKRFPKISATKYGVEVLFWMTDTNDILEVSLYQNIGSSQVQYAARVNGNTDALEAYNTTPGYTTLQALSAIALSTESWNVLKMVIDASNQTYKSVRFNDTLISSGLPTPDTVGSITDPGLIELRLKKTNPVSGAKAVYIAGIVVTVDEP